MATILADGILKSNFLNENGRTVIQISLIFVPRGPIDNKSALVHIKSLPEPVHWCVYVALGGDELNLVLVMVYL